MLDTNAACDRLRGLLLGAIREVAGDPASCARDPGRDFTRRRSLPPDALMWLLCTMGRDTLDREIRRAGGGATVGALCQQWSKLNDSAMPRLLAALLSALGPAPPVAGRRVLVVDGTDLPVAPDPGDARTRRGTGGRSGAEFNEAHASLVLDLGRGTFEDMVVVGCREQDERAELLELVARAPRPAGGPPVLWVGDRGFCSFNTVCSLAASGDGFLLRATAAVARALLGGDAPDAPFDVEVDHAFVRAGRPSARTMPGRPDLYTRVPAGRALGPLDGGGRDEWWVHLRVVGVPGRGGPDGGGPLVLVTNVWSDELGAAALAGLYRRRWEIETAFDLLKHTVGLESTHARPLGKVAQEWWGRLALYDLCAVAAAESAPGGRGRRRPERRAAFRAVMDRLRGTGGALADVASTMGRMVQTVRPGRRAPRRPRAKPPPSFLRR